MQSPGGPLPTPPDPRCIGETVSANARFSIAGPRFHRDNATNVAVTLDTDTMHATGSLPLDKPEAVGLSAARLARLTDALRADIERKLLPGAVALIARRGRIAYLEALGLRDPATGGPMREDSIFRIYSMTKPIVSAAVMMLVEDGQVKLSDPAAKFLPQFAGPKVAVERDGTVELVPAVRDITSRTCCATPQASPTSSAAPLRCRRCT